MTSPKISSANIPICILKAKVNLHHDFRHLLWSKSKILFLILLFLLPILSKTQSLGMWGLTSRGGQDDYGVVFRTDTTGSNQVVVHEFQKVSGNQPHFVKLVLSDRQTFIGTAAEGGDNNEGIIFEYDPVRDIFKELASFDNSVNGRRPESGLLVASDGMLYGMTRFGGSHDVGILYQFDPNTNILTKLYDFDTINGSFPRGSLIEPDSNLIYGMTPNGGVFNQGVLFQYDIQNSLFTKKIDFRDSLSGALPQGGLYSASNGKLYGLTWRGGLNDDGVFFEYDRFIDKFTKLVDMDLNITGARPYGSVVEIEDELFGLCSGGGQNFKGALFRFNYVTNTYGKEVDCSMAYGSFPFGDLIIANGQLYGMTSSGGDHNRGTLFKYDPVSKVYTKMFDFDGGADGNNPYGSLALGPNNKLYGLTRLGGTFAQGVLFEYDLNKSPIDILHNFDGYLGSHPTSSMTWYYNAFLGTTKYGGRDFKVGKFQGAQGKQGGSGAKDGVLDPGDGVIFEYDPIEQQFKRKRFLGIRAERPDGGLIEGTPGRLFGLAREGGFYGYGGLYEYDPVSNKVWRRHSFNTTEVVVQTVPYNVTLAALFSGNIKELSARARVQKRKEIAAAKYQYGYDKTLGDLVLKNNKLYGVTPDSGMYNTGGIFEYNPADSSFHYIFNFKDTIDEGIYPKGTLLAASDGLLYGLTETGGINDDGVLFAFDPVSRVFMKKADFRDTITGKRPLGSLMQASNGLIYGVTSAGGNYGYRLRQGATKGVAGLLQGLAGGYVDEGFGTLFEFNPTTGILRKAADFEGINGKHPTQTKLIEMDNGFLYGMSPVGGIEDKGVLFEFNPNTDTLINKADMYPQCAYPHGGLSLGPDGLLYGMARNGGENGFGVIFRYDPYHPYSKKLDFQGAKDGRYPYGTLEEASDTKLYGLTTTGGLNDHGVIFSVDPLSKEFKKVYDLQGDNTGKYPSGSLTRYDSLLFGVTREGGLFDDGVLFRFDPKTGEYRKVLEFYELGAIGTTTLGTNPVGKLVDGRNKRLYGLCQTGGYNASGTFIDHGTLFEFDPRNNQSKDLVVFEGTTKGRSPEGSLIRASNGRFYGMTRFGGDHNMGVLFEYRLGILSYAKMHDFDGASTGANPRGSLFEASNGKLYGMTSSGGANNKGVIFEFDFNTQTFMKKLDFDGNNGRDPRGRFMESSNGKLYAMTYWGGSNDLGVLFEYDPETDSFTKKLDFNSSNGARAFHSTLLQVDCRSSFDTVTVDTCSRFTSPSGLYTWDTTGVYTDTLTNVLGCDSIVTFILTINYEHSYVNVNACNAYISPSAMYVWDSTGIYYDTVRTVEGCDLLFKVFLTIGKSTATIIDTTVCDSLVTPTGRFLTYSGIFLDTLTNSSGCDSVLIYDLTVLLGSQGYTEITACDSILSPSGWYDWSESGFYYDTLPNSVGCDSILLVNLTIINSTSSSFAVSACDSYTSPSGKYTWTISGIYHDTIPNAAGCDSSMAIDLTINKNSSSTQSVVVCDSFVSPSGKVYVISGTYYDTLANAIGCDSIITTHLTVAPIQVLDLILVDATTGADLGPLKNGSVINKQTQGPWSIRAEVCDISIVGSVRFYVDGALQRNENIAPYSINGDGGGTYTPWNPLAGTYLINATPYSSPNGNGTVGLAKILSITVIDSAYVDCNGDSLGSAYLNDCGICVEGNTGFGPDEGKDDCGVCFGGNADKDSCGVCFGNGLSCSGCVANEVVDLVLMYAGHGGVIKSLNPVDTVIRSQTGNFSIDALVCSDPDVESVRFYVNGALERNENIPPYAIAGDNASAGYKSWNVSAGNYMVTAIPYSGNNGGGTPGVSKTVDLWVFDSAPARSVPGSNPSISSGLDQTDPYVPTGGSEPTEADILAGFDTEPQMLVYPNPTTGEIHLDIMQVDDQEADMILIDATGKTLDRHALKPIEGVIKHRLQLEELESGVYMIRVVLGEQILSQRVVKK